MKKQVSVRMDEDLYHIIDEKAKELGVSKSSYLSFAASFFTHQLNQAEQSAGSYSVNMYEIIKNNLEDQYKK